MVKFKRIALSRCPVVFFVLSIVMVGLLCVSPAVAAQAQKSAVEPSKEVTAPPAAAKKAVAAPKLAPGEKVNINTASKEKLEALPGIGPDKAQAIIDGRPYKKTDDLMKVKGIKGGTYDKIKEHIMVE